MYESCFEKVLLSGENVVADNGEKQKVMYTLIPTLYRTKRIK